MEETDEITRTMRWLRFMAKILHRFPIWFHNEITEIWTVLRVESVRELLEKKSSLM